MSLTIHTDFPGGNAIVDKIEGDDVHVRQDIRDTEGHWFYWCFGVKGAAGRTLRFHLENPPMLTSRGPAVSLDAGLTWSWIDRDGTDCESFTFAFPADANDVRFSMGMPYTFDNLRRFIKKHDGGVHFHVGELCKTKKNRPVPMIRFGDFSGEPKFRILLTARHHCCEMMASYSMEGVIEGVLADDPVGKCLRRNVEFLAIPFVDADGVEDGDQGKNRIPRDHNRDYVGEPVHNETAALRKLVPQWSEGKLLAAFDLHCPYIVGTDCNEHIYIVGSPNAAIAEQQEFFGKILDKTATGPLPYSEAGTVKYGTYWNTDDNEDDGLSCCRWAGELPGVKLSASFEIPYAVASGAEVNHTSARLFGRDLAAAIAAYVKEQ